MDDRSLSQNLAKRFGWLGYPSDARRLHLCSSARSAPTPKHLDGVPLHCEHRICPVCIPYVQKRAVDKLTPVIRPLLVAGGGAIHLTLTTPWNKEDYLGPSRRLLRVFRAFAKSWTWIARGKGLSRRVGMVFSLEFTGRGKAPAEPHLHIFLFSWDAEAVHECSHLIQDFWRRHHPETGKWGIKDEQVTDDWERALQYVLKSSRVHPGWSDELLVAALELLHSGLRLRGGYGLAKLKGGLFGRGPSRREAPYISRLEGGTTGEVHPVAHPPRALDDDLDPVEDQPAPFVAGWFLPAAHAAGWFGLLGGGGDVLGRQGLRLEDEVPTDDLPTKILSVGITESN